jgi:predicted methyltransferase
MRKPNANAVLLNLPEEQQAKLADWLTSGMPYWKASELVQKEFGVKVLPSAFTGFWSAVCSAALQAKRARAVNLSNDVAQMAERHPGQFDAATIDALKQKAFELAVSPTANPKDVKALLMLVLKARDQDLEKRKIDMLQEKLDRAKREIDAATTMAKTKGGLTQETLALIEQAAKLL